MYVHMDTKWIYNYIHTYTYNDNKYRRRGHKIEKELETGRVMREMEG